MDPLLWSPTDSSTVALFEKYFPELSLLSSPNQLAEFSDALWSDVDVSDMTFQQKLRIIYQVKMAMPESV